MHDKLASPMAFADRLGALRDHVGVGVSSKEATEALAQLVADIDAAADRPNADRPELGWWAASAVDVMALTLVHLGDADKAARAYDDAARRWTDAGDAQRSSASARAAAEQAVAAGGALDGAITGIVADLDRRHDLDRVSALTRVAQLASNVGDRFEAGRRLDDAAGLLSMLGYPDPSDDPASAIATWQATAAADQPDPLRVMRTMTTVIVSWGTLLSIRGAIGRGWATSAIHAVAEFGMQSTGHDTDPRARALIERSLHLNRLRDEYDHGPDVPDAAEWARMHDAVCAIVAESRAGGGQAQLVTMAQTLEVDLLTWASRAQEAADLLVTARRELAEANLPQENRSGLDTELIRRQVEIAAGADDSAAVSTFAGDGIAVIEADRARLHLPYLEDSYLRTRRRIYIAGIAAARKLDDLELMLARADLVKARGALAWLPGPPADVPAIRASLDADEAVIYHLWAERTVLYVFTVTRDDIVCDRRLLTDAQRADLDALLADFQDPHNRPPVWADAEVPRLAATFLPSDGAVALDGQTRMYLSPNGVGHQVPMHALDWHGRPLLASFAVSYVPNFAALTRRTARPATGVPVVVGIGRFADAPTLAHAEAEAADVASRYPDADALLGAAASCAAIEARVTDGRLSSAPVLHLATHGEDGPVTDPLAARFLLADGDVTGTSMTSWRLNADLVVLSACWSAQRAVVGRDGSELFGDEVYGLQSAFFRAGARQVFGAMWPASDRVTAPLMRRVHELVHDGVAADVAVQTATLEARDRDTLLYHWAPYKLTTIGRPPLETET